MLDKVYVVHFSPAGNTRKAALMLAGELAVQVEEYDLTLPLGERRSFAPSDVVIAAGPVYGGRLPGVMAERLSRVQGNGAWFISLAVYGNRAYEDALAELDDRMEQQGFSRLASAALVAQHSIVTQLAAGRPDGQDRREIAEFAGEILHKLKTLAEGNRPEEKATPGCLRALHERTYEAIQNSISVLTEQAYEKLLEEEQAAMGWEEHDVKRMKEDLYIPRLKQGIYDTLNKSSSMPS